MVCLPRIKKKEEQGQQNKAISIRLSALTLLKGSAILAVFLLRKGITIMNKIIVQIYLPANGKTYDVRLPEDMYVRDAADVLGDLFSDAARGLYCKGEVNILCFRDRGESLPQNRTLKELGISNRSQLMFV